MPAETDTLMAINGGVLQILQGMYQGHASAASVQGTKPLIPLTDWAQVLKKYAYTFVPAPASASTDLESSLLTVSPNFAGGIIVFGAWICPNGALTGDPTNNAIFQLGSRPQAGGGSQTAIGGTLTTTASWVANSQVVLFTSTPGVAVAQNLVLTVNRTHGGTGVANPAYTMVVEYMEA